MFPGAAVLGAAGTAASGLMSYFNNKRIQEQADAENARQRAYYAAKAAEDPLSRSENQRLLNQYDRQSQQQIENARGVAKITGATPEYSLGVQKGVAQGRADLMGNIAAGASAQRDKYEALGEQAAHEKAMGDIERKAARNESFAALASNAANAVGGLVDSYAGGFGNDPDYAQKRMQHWQGKIDTAKAAGKPTDWAEGRFNYWQGRYNSLTKQN